MGSARSRCKFSRPRFYLKRLKRGSNSRNKGFFNSCKS